MADVAEESPHDHGIRGLLHRPDDPLSRPVRVLGAGARPRRILHVAVTAHPTAEWTAQQLREAFPWETAPRYLLRDRDGIFGPVFVSQVRALGMSEVLSIPGSPWPRAYIERVIGTIRRECLDHVLVFTERSLRSHVSRFVAYYHSVASTLLFLLSDGTALPRQSAFSRSLEPMSRTAAVNVIIGTDGSPAHTVADHNAVTGH